MSAHVEPAVFTRTCVGHTSLYAAIGAMCNSDEGAQQAQWPVLMLLVGFTLAVNLVVDLLYTVIDPRIRRQP